MSIYPPTGTLEIKNATLKIPVVDLQYTSNTAKLEANSNVVTEFSRSKKLIKYPRVALTQNALNNGYTANASTQENVNRHAWKVFNNTYAEGDGWRSAQSYTSDGSFTGTFVDFSNGGQTFNAVDKGEWLKITLPEKMRLERFRLQPRYSPTTGGAPYSYGRSEFVKNGAIWGSNDGSSWDRVYMITHGVPAASDTTIAEFTVQNSTTAYNNFVLVVTDTHGSSAGLRTSFSEWELLGVPEYDPEADGTDMTVKSLPNVPNTDWLEVYYDAKGETTMPDPVPDLAGGDQNATVSGVTLNNEAFVFNGSSYLETSVPQITTGQWPFTMSFWFKVNEHIGSTWNYLAHLGNRQGTAGDSTLVGLQNDQISITTWGDSKINSGVVATPGVWYHVTSTWPGGAFYDNAKLYINAVSYGDTDNTRNEANPLSFPTSGNKLTLGKQMNTTSDYFNGSIANFRLFNRALSQDEIYQLYAHQKEYFGHGDLSMTLKAGRLGIGTSEPRAMLDVRGDFYAPGSVVQIQTNVFTAAPSTSDHVWKDISSNFGVTITPKFANSNFLIQAMIHQGGDQNDDARWTMYRIGRYVNDTLTEVGNGDTSTTGNGTACTAAHNWGAISAASTSTYDNHVANINILFVDQPNTTSPITYRIRWNSNPGGAATASGTRTAYINRSDGHNDGYRANTISTLVITEIAQ